MFQQKIGKRKQICSQSCGSTFDLSNLIEFSLGGDAILQNHQKTKKKKSSSKMLPQWELNPRPLTFMPCMLLSELIPYWLEVLDL